MISGANQRYATRAGKKRMNATTNVTSPAVIRRERIII
jgi:hypothetical protein